MTEDKTDRSCKILKSGFPAGAVNQSKRVEACFGYLQCMRKTIMHGPNEGKGAAGVADSKTRPRVTTEEEQASVPLGRIGKFFLIRINVIKDPIPFFSLLFQEIHDLHVLFWICAVVSQTKGAECMTAVAIICYSENSFHNSFNVINLSDRTTVSH